MSLPSDSIALLVDSRSALTRTANGSDNNNDRSNPSNTTSATTSSTPTSTTPPPIDEPNESTMEEKDSTTPTPAASDMPTTDPNYTSNQDHDANDDMNPPPAPSTVTKIPATTRSTRHHKPVDYTKERIVGAEKDQYLRAKSGIDDEQDVTMVDVDDDDDQNVSDAADDFSNRTNTRTRGQKRKMDAEESTASEDETAPPIDASSDSSASNNRPSRRRRRRRGKQTGSIQPTRRSTRSQSRTRTRSTPFGRPVSSEDEEDEQEFDNIVAGSDDDDVIQIEEEDEDEEEESEEDEDDGSTRRRPRRASRSVNLNENALYRKNFLVTAQESASHKPRGRPPTSLRKKQYVSETESEEEEDEPLTDEQQTLYELYQARDLHKLLGIRQNPDQAARLAAAREKATKAKESQSNSVPASTTPASDGAPSTSADSSAPSTTATTESAPAPAPVPVPPSITSTSVVIDLSNDTSEEAAEEEEIIYQFYVKWKNLGYIHCVWLDEAVVEKFDRGYDMIGRFLKKQEAGGFNEVEWAEGIYFNQNYLQVERVFARRGPVMTKAQALEALGITHAASLKESNNASDSNTGESTSSTLKSKPKSRSSKSLEDTSLYYVKWRDLPYNESTWESVHDIHDAKKIQQYWEMSDLTSHEISPIDRPTTQPPDLIETIGKQVIEMKFRNPDIKLRPYQVEGVTWMAFNWMCHRSGQILADEMGLGKCWGRGTKMLMYDGTLKNVEDIRPGDQLVGDDSTPRTVQPGSIHRGNTCNDGINAGTYRIQADAKGSQTWTCNGEHILVLTIDHRPSPIQTHSTHTSQPSSFFYTLFVRDGKNNVTEKIFHFSTLAAAESSHSSHLSQCEPFIWECSVDAFLQSSPRVQAASRMFKPSLIQFGRPNRSLAERIEAFTGSEPTSDEIIQIARDIGSWLTNPCQPRPNILHSYEELTTSPRHIPADLLRESVHIRRALLDGAIGHDTGLLSANSRVEVFIDSTELMNGLLTLARSIGLIAYEHSTGYVTIECGDSHAFSLDPKHSFTAFHHFHSFSITRVPHADYFGFTLDGNGRCLLGDGTITHNTLQVCSVFQFLSTYMHLRGPFLIVAPLSTIPHWQRELSLTDLNAVAFDGLAEARAVVREYEWNHFEVDGKPQIVKGKYRFDVCLISYATVLTEAATLSRVPWSVIVVDEAQRSKGMQSKFTNILQARLKYDHAILLTGTPLQNNLTELFSLLHTIDPNEFPRLDSFIESYGELHSSDQISELHSRLRPYLLRRMKEDVEKNLPPRTETVIWVDMTPTQRQFYRAIYEQNGEMLTQLTGRFGRSKKVQKENRVTTPSLMNIAMQLRHVSNHPFLIKANQQIELNRIEQLRSERKKQGLSTDGPEFHAEVMKQLIAASGKFILLSKLLPKLHSQGHRCLIFSQFKLCLDILEDFISYLGFPYERLDGDVTGDSRQAAIDRFSAKDSDRFIFLLSTRAGGVGINLMAADTVILFDSDWNPQNDIQAQARAHRIGQNRPVMVYRLISRSTYEDHMFQTSSLKLGLDHAVLKSYTSKDGNSAPILSRDQMEEMLKKGAYHVFLDNTVSHQLNEDDIDVILQRDSKVITYDAAAHESNGDDSNGLGSNSFSKATFVLDDETIDLHSEDFWDKIGLKAKEKEPELPRQRLRKAVNYFAEQVIASSSPVKKRRRRSDSSGSEFDAEGSTDDSSSDSSQSNPPADDEESENDGNKDHTRRNSSPFRHPYAIPSELADVLFDALELYGYNRWDTMRAYAKARSHLSSYSRSVLERMTDEALKYFSLGLIKQHVLVVPIGAGGATTLPGDAVIRSQGLKYDLFKSIAILRDAETMIGRYQSLRGDALKKLQDEHTAKQTAQLASDKAKALQDASILPSPSVPTPQPAVTTTSQPAPTPAPQPAPVSASPAPKPTEPVASEPTKCVVNLTSCGHCGNSDGPQSKCGACNTVVYCSRQCQVTDWKNRHKSECAPRAKDFDIQKQALDAAKALAEEKEKQKNRNASQTSSAAAQTQEGQQPSQPEAVDSSKAKEPIAPSKDAEKASELLKEGDKSVADHSATVESVKEAEKPVESAESVAPAPPNPAPSNSNGCPKGCTLPPDGADIPCEILDETTHKRMKYLVHWQGYSRDIDNDDVTVQESGPWRDTYPELVAEWEAKKAAEKRKERKFLADLAKPKTETNPTPVKNDTPTKTKSSSNGPEKATPTPTPTPTPNVQAKPVSIEPLSSNGTELTNDAKAIVPQGSTDQSAGGEVPLIYSSVSLPFGGAYALELINHNGFVSRESQEPTSLLEVILSVPLDPSLTSLSMVRRCRKRNFIQSLEYQHIIQHFVKCSPTTNAWSVELPLLPSYRATKNLPDWWNVTRDSIEKGLPVCHDPNKTNDRELILLTYLFGMTTKLVSYLLSPHLTLHAIDGKTVIINQHIDNPHWRPDIINPLQPPTLVVPHATLVSTKLGLQYKDLQAQIRILTTLLRPYITTLPKGYCPPLSNEQVNSARHLKKAFVFRPLVTINDLAPPKAVPAILVSANSSTSSTLEPSQLAASFPDQSSKPLTAQANDHLTFENQREQIKSILDLLERNRQQRLLREQEKREREARRRNEELERHRLEQEAQQRERARVAEMERKRREEWQAQQERQRRLAEEARQQEARRIAEQKRREEERLQQKRALEQQRRTDELRRQHQMNMAPMPLLQPLLGLQPFQSPFPAAAVSPALAAPSISNVQSFLAAADAEARAAESRRLAQEIAKLNADSEAENAALLAEITAQLAIKKRLAEQKAELLRKKKALLEEENKQALLELAEVEETDRESVSRSISKRVESSSSSAINETVNKTPSGTKSKARKHDAIEIDSEDGDQNDLSTPLAKKSKLASTSSSAKSDTPKTYECKYCGKSSRTGHLLYIHENELCLKRPGIEPTPKKKYNKSNSSNPPASMPSQPSDPLSQTPSSESESLTASDRDRGESKSMELDEPPSTSIVADSVSTPSRHSSGSNASLTRLLRKLDYTPNANLRKSKQSSSASNTPTGSPTSSPTRTRTQTPSRSPRMH